MTMREAIPPRMRLAVTLRFLANSSTYQDLAYSTRIAPNTLSKIVPECLRALVKGLERKLCLKFPSRPTEWKAVAGNFHAFWQFPNCIGALDWKHIAFRRPRREGSQYRNYKGFDSIVLLALADASYKFLFVDIGRNGHMRDAAVFRESVIYDKMSSKSLKLPPKSPLPGDEVPMPYVTVADEAFPLKIHLMKPYPRCELNNENSIFNYRLSRARRVDENAFDILANRFAILLRTTPLAVEKVQLIVYTCCLLHNFLLERYSSRYIPPDFRDSAGVSSLRNVSQQGGNRNRTTAIEVRKKFTAYFNSHGKVPWQDASVEKGNY